MRRPADPASLAGAGAAALWVLVCVRWLDDGAAWRPAWLQAMPPAVLAALAAGLAATWTWSRRRAFLDPEATGDARPALALAALAFFFRLPLAWHGAAGYVTADGSLSGTMALRLREGISRLVFVPNVPYSGSLKSHLTAVLSFLVDPPRAFAIASVLFYALFVAAVFLLARRAAPGARAIAAGAALYAIFSPAFVTRYSLSNDGNYVEVLALGTWALVFVERLLRADEPRGGVLALAAGLLLGLAQWSHLLATIHVAAAGVALATAGGLRLLRAFPGVAGGFVLGYLPGLLWNAGHGWASALYLVPGGQPVGEAGSVGLDARVRTIVATQLPVLFGYDPGYGPLLDRLLAVASWSALALALAATALAVRDALASPPAVRLLLILTAVNVGLALLALPALAGNPRYLLFLIAPAAVFLARWLSVGPRRWALGALLLLGLAGSWAQAPGAFRADARWRAFVRGLAEAGVTHCYTDFFIAAKLNFLSRERVVCSAKLGPTTTEYFLDLRERVERAPSAALVPVNETAAEKLERRLQRLGVAYARHELMKPVIVPGRKVDPEELFPGRDFPAR